MQKEDIRHLANLARLNMTEEELDKFATQFDEILRYVDKVKEFDKQYGASNENLKIKNSIVKNVFRSDDEIMEGGIFTDKILNESPHIKDGFVKVKKILNND